MSLHLLTSQWNYFLSPANLVLPDAMRTLTDPDDYLTLACEQ